MRDWVDREIENWVRWYWSGPYPGPMAPNFCRSMEDKYAIPSPWNGEDVEDQLPQPIYIEHALIVQHIYNRLSVTEKRVAKAEYLSPDKSRRWQENGLALAAQRADVPVLVYESTVLNFRQQIKGMYNADH